MRNIIERAGILVEIPLLLLLFPLLSSGASYSNDLIGTGNNSLLPTYASAREEAARKSLPFVVYVDCKAPPKSKTVGTVVYECIPGEMVGGVIKGILISLPDSKGGLYWDKTLSSRAPWLTVLTEIRVSRGEVGQMPTPFEQYLRGEYSPSPRNALAPPALRDDRNRAVGPWPEGIPYPKGLQSYAPAKMTQSAFKMYGSPVFRSVPRTSLLRKWLVPGGMESVTGWRSDLYKLVPSPVDSGRGLVPTQTQFGTQMEWGVRRSYPSGTVFMDVLSKDGEVFEHRVREKVGNTWRSYVIYRRVSARPAGYHGLQGVQCASCHNEAGTGSYSAPGLVPGGDTVLSDPFTELEIVESSASVE